MNKLEIDAQGIALELLRGGEAEVVGEGFLAGLPVHFMEVDGVAVQVPRPEIKEAAGVRVTLPDGFVALHVTTSAERAEALLARAREIVAKVEA